MYRYIRYNDIGLLQHIFNLYDGTDTIFYDYNSLLTNSGDNKNNDLKQHDVFHVKLDNDYDVIKIELILSLIDNVTNTVDCKIYNAYNSNFLCIKYYKKINLVSVHNNLGDLENTILSNKNDIDYIKNNISKSYLKNIYNISFYDEKTQVNLGKIFYEKIFDVNFKQNSFVEISFKMLLEYEDISQKNFVSTIYEILDENNNSLYFSQINNNEYQHFSNKLSIKENIFYNFNNNIEKIKFRISFVKTAIKISYINDNNHRFILKHYGN